MAGDGRGMAVLMAGGGRKDDVAADRRRELWRRSWENGL